MMKLLAFDTSTEYMSIALQIGDEMLTDFQQAGAKASQLILPTIQQLLNQAGVTLNDLDGIVFGAGPGAFTGVRVACGVAQGLAFGANLPVVGINTLHAVAEASGEEKVLVCQDARMAEVYYAALIKQNNRWQEHISCAVAKPEMMPTLDGDDWFAAGSGWAVYQTVLTQKYAQNVKQVLPDMTPVATAMMALATPMFLAGEAKQASEAAPVYIRNRVALTTKQREQGMRL